ncbi:MAG: hypothetical protein KBF78_16760 [Fuscovulum sp.]|nr:hypothetical protein [Fuscovulum sp.]
MSLFATEFFLKDDFGKAAFAAEVLAWVRGMRHSKLSETQVEREIDGDNVRIAAEGGESLMMRALGTGDLRAI